MYYVIQVRTGKEDKVIEEIAKQNRKAVVFDAFSPRRKTKRKYKGEWIEVEERCFPGYVFVETDAPKQLFKDLYWIPEFTRLLGREEGTDNFIALSDEEARMVDILYGKQSERVTDISLVEVKEGDIVRILDGPLRDLEAKIKKVNLHKRKVTIGVVIAGISFDAEVGVEIVMKLRQND